MQVPRSVQLGGLALLAVADVALVIAVLRPTADDTGRASTPSTTVTTTASPTTTPSGTSTTGPAPAATASVAALAVVDDTVAYRAAAAGCSVADPGLQRTNDGGRTWRPVALPGARSVVRIEFTSASEGYVVGTSDGCALKVWRTSSGGAEWTAPGSAADFWSALPSSATQVSSARGARTPCAAGTTVVQVARVTDSDTWVLCSKGQVRHTTDTGATWSTAATVVGAEAVTVDRRAGTRLVLAGADPTCSGTRIWSMAPTAKAAAVAGLRPDRQAHRTGRARRRPGLALARARQAGVASRRSPQRVEPGLTSAGWMQGARPARRHSPESVRGGARPGRRRRRRPGRGR